jgi:hypothetical protein
MITGHNLTKEGDPISIEEEDIIEVVEEAVRIIHRNNFSARFIRNGDIVD